MTDYPKLNTEQINTLIEKQLMAWPLAAKNFSALRETRRRNIALGDLGCAVQYNPARIVSTGAKTDKASIEKRPCFLCKSNRPDEQGAIDWAQDFELLMNPYPILPVHFTLACTRHIPQGRVPVTLGITVESAPDLTFFYNGAKAGASAPDHLHMQAVLRDELPLLRVAQQHHRAEEGVCKCSEDMELDLPYQFYSTIVPPDERGMQMLQTIRDAFGVDAESGEADTGLVNAYFFMGHDGWMRAVVVPRHRHRPRCYGQGAEEFVVSPGAIDMAGLMITPRLEDFERMEEAKMREIYADTAFAEELPATVKEHFERCNRMCR